MRALRILREAAFILAEDTRTSRKLLDHFGIHKPTISYHDHNEFSRAEELTARLLSAEKLKGLSSRHTRI